jgi:fumarate reductase subunit C
VIDQWKFMENPRFVARVDLIEMISGLLLVLFMFGHMLMLSTILFGKGTMDGLAGFLEDFYLAQAGAVGVAVLLVIHFVTAGRKLPSRVREQTMMWRLSRHLRHTDTWLWTIQAVTGMIILLFGAIHLWVILTTFPIEAIKSSVRVAESYGYLYLPMILVVELHVGIGLYRAVIKWTAFNRRTGAIIKWGLTGIFLVIGYSILVAFWSYGISSPSL